MHRYADRRAAGCLLAQRLVHFKSKAPVVLALPRGGVPVGLEIALVLEAPMDLIMVRKIGAPGQPELAVAAVVDGDSPRLVLNKNIKRHLQVSDDYIAKEEARQLKELERRREVYLGGTTREPIAGRTAIIVDDGIATGATMRAAVQAVRSARPRWLVLAVPVAPPDALETLQPEVDEIVCLQTPEAFSAIGYFYADFSQVSDAEVTRAMQQAGAVKSAKG